MNANVLHIAIALIKAYITTSYVVLLLQCNCFAKKSTENGIHSPFYSHIVISRIINEKKRLDW